MHTLWPCVFVTLGLFLVLSQPLLAQDGPVVSPSAARLRFSTDYATLVNQNYPAYEDAVLARRLDEAARILGSRTDLVTIRTLAGVERLLGLPPGGATASVGEVDTETAYYRVSPNKVYAQLKNPSYLGLERERFEAIEATVQALHRDFLTLLGLPEDERMQVSYKRVMVQSLTASSPNNSDGTPALVRRGFTLVSRGFGGFPIERSEVRVSSYTGERVDSFALRWPKFQLHPQVTDTTLDSTANIKRAILEQVQRAVVRGDQIAIYMGVVFRPVKTEAGQLVHIPAMKTIVTPVAKPVADQPQSVLTEGGLVFYTNILRTAPVIQSENQRDENPLTP